VGEVIGTFPQAGERMPLPASINLIVSGGPAPARPDSALPPDTLPRRTH
jgi:beta-lactam-binding protein with PASTA domain